MTKKKKPCNCGDNKNHKPHKVSRFHPYKFDSEGFGDTVYKLIGYISLGLIKPCRACNKRRQVLNRMFPYRAKAKDD